MTSVAIIVMGLANVAFALMLARTETSRLLFFSLAASLIISGVVSLGLQQYLRNRRRIIEAESRSTLPKPDPPDPSGSPGSSM